MPLLLVTYELSGIDHKESDLLNEINHYSNVRLSGSSYAIITDKFPSKVCSEMNRFLNTGDKLFVINLKGPYDGYGSDFVKDWLRKTLTR